MKTALLSVPTQPGDGRKKAEALLYEAGLLGLGETLKRPLIVGEYADQGPIIVHVGDDDMITFSIAHDNAAPIKQRLDRCAQRMSGIRAAS